MVSTRRSNSIDANLPVKEEVKTLPRQQSSRQRRTSSSGPKRNSFLEKDDNVAPTRTRHSARLHPEQLPSVISSHSKSTVNDELPKYSSTHRSSRRISVDNVPVADQQPKRERRLCDGHRMPPSRRGRDFATMAPVRRSSRRSAAHYSSHDVEEQLVDDEAQDILLHNDDQYIAGPSTMEKEKRREKNRAELRDLLAAQGKDLSDMQSYMEPDIYSSVKSRKRSRTRTRLYEAYYTSRSRHRKEEQEEESQSDSDDDDVEEEDDEDDNTNEEQEEEATENESDEEENDEDGHPYKLRKVREAPQRYTIVRDVVRHRRPRSLFEDLPCSPVRRRRKKVQGVGNYNPYQRRRRKARAQGNSSTSDSSSDDEIKFQKRQERSMARARNQCMPINMSSADLASHSFARDRKKIGQSLADIDPMKLDSSVKFSSVGGHHKHIRALKEMVVFPLLYPEVFEKFNITPPRGCLFYGPPGTGKTLMARALSNECSTEGRRVSFFMKKGADCLSKWIGESERQLRLLFDQAYQMRPSIIFFDEIDGLAPVRSTRQDQIHSSIVSTLLALMDGLDGRGEIVVIGATNRIDSIDPALRRPGRFDREFLFPLPDKEARKEILRIHTSAWNPQLKPSFIDYLATKTVGYCGADLKALCTEAALFALRRRYPQIYKSSEKLQLDVGSIKISSSDFQGAIKNIIPTAQRSASNPGRALSSAIKPLMDNSLKRAVLQLTKVYPVLHGKSKLLQEMNGSNANMTDTEDGNDTDGVMVMGGIYVGEPDASRHLNFELPSVSGTCNGIVQSQYSSLLQRLSSTEHSLSTMHRPRFLICGEFSSGHMSHLAPAILHDMEGVPIHTIDLPALYGVSVRTPEESCAQVFREARRVTPSVIYMPNALQWWSVATLTVQATFESLLRDIPPHLPILFLATARCSYKQLPRDLAHFFHSDFSEVFELSLCVTADERTEFFAPIFLIHAVTPPPRSRVIGQSTEILAKAPAPEPAPLTEVELRKIEEEEESTLRNLRLFLRDVLMRLSRDRRFKIFSKPVDFEEVPDYFEVIKNPMDFSTILTKIDQHKYQTVANFMEDVDLICSNALEYNPDRCPEDKLIRHRACAMRDMAHAIVDQDLDPDFEKLCCDLVESRKRRGADPNKYAPKFSRVIPKHMRIDEATGMLISTPDKSLSEEPSKAVTEPNQAKTPGEKTPWKGNPPQKKAPSATKSKRKRSTWSRGFVPRYKRKRVAPSVNDGEEMKEKEDRVDEEEEDNKETLEEEKNEEAAEAKPDVDVEMAVNETLKEEKSEEITEVEKSIEESKNVSFAEQQEEIQISVNGHESPIAELAELVENDENTQILSAENENQAQINVQLDETITENSIVTKIVIAETKNEILENGQDVVNGSEKNKNNEIGIVIENNEMELLPDNDQKTDEPVAVIHSGLDGENREMDSKESEEKISENVKDEEEEENISVEIDIEPEVAPRRMTLRSRDRPTSISETQLSTAKPMEVEPPPPPMIVDHKKLAQLLEDVVEATESFTVEELERVHSSLSRCIQKHKMSYDRTELIKDLSEEIKVIASSARSGLTDASFTI